MRIDKGTGWVRRWFAKPFDKGSIPSLVSKFIGLEGHCKYNDPRQRLFVQGQMFAITLLQEPRSPYWAGVFFEVWCESRKLHPKSLDVIATPVHKLVMKKHHQLHKALNELESLREKHIAMSRELSILKRQNKQKSETAQ